MGSYYVLAVFLPASLMFDCFVTFAVDFLGSSFFCGVSLAGRVLKKFAGTPWSAHAAALATICSTYYHGAFLPLWASWDLMLGRTLVFLFILSLQQGRSLSHLDLPSLP
jgi:hypothetical protein